MFGSLQRDADSGKLAELPGPHARAVHYVLGLDVALWGPDAGDGGCGQGASAGQEPGHRDAFDDPYAELAGTLGQRHRDVDRVHPAVCRDVEAGEHVVSPRQRPEFGDFSGGDLVHLDAAVPVECGHAPVLLQPACFDRQLDQAHLAHPGGQTSLSLEPEVQVAGVLTQLG